MLRIRSYSCTALLVILLLQLSACMPLVNVPGQATVAPCIKDNFYVTDDGTRLPVRAWLPEDRPIKAVIVGVHGFNDYSFSFALPGSYLVRYGIGTYAYDQRGFGGAPGKGLWSGIDAYTNDLSRFVALVRSLHPNLPLYVMGESMGGAVAIVTLTARQAPPVDGAILVAPAVWGRSAMPWYQRLLLAVTSHTVPWLELTGDSLGIAPSDNLEMRRALYLDPQVIKGTRVDAMHGLTNLMDEALERSGQLSVPTLVLYGKHDQVIPKEAMLQAVEKMSPAVRIAFYERGYHMLLRDVYREKPLIDIATWIADPGRILPYGATTLY